MYAIVETGGHQWKVRPGQVLDVDLRQEEPGSTIVLDRVLLLADNDRILVGAPTVPGASVSATVLGAIKGKKIIVFKYKSKTRYRRRMGHRQRYTRL
ncbi:MAG: 50S ribosomal protein L21, partial [Dehalococcoidia bacterium]|nr:50S ribosomal protein L21 [Dehalococcoidia bacterium]